MAAFRFDRLYAGGAWHAPGYLTVGDAGMVTAAGSEPPEGDIAEIGGIAVPGIPNLHSHAFQRAMAGLSEFRTDASSDSFWTWRELMYRFVGRLTPDDLEAIAAQLYVEMLKAGYTAVAEFQYLHHDPAGARYADPAEMTQRTLSAAADTGIAAMLLPVLYQYSGFGEAPPADGQRRFINDADGYLSIYESASAAARAHANIRVGAAPHSLRAAGTATMETVAAAIDPAAPIHIHIAEQVKEVADCEAWSGARPVRYLLDTLAVDGRWCLVHATHMTEDEAADAAQAGAIAGLCPTTEANLGDGFFELSCWLDAGGALGVGSDSHISVSPVEELRWLEYGQRLRGQARNVAATADASTGRRLIDLAVAGGAQATGRIGTDGQTALSPGAPADLVVLDGDHPLLTGQAADTVLDSWIFSGNAALVRDVFVGGRQVVTGGHHGDEEAIAARYAGVMDSLLA